MRKTTTQHAQVTRPAARLVNYRLGVGVHEETTGKGSDVVADLIAFSFFHREGNPCFGSSRPTELPPLCAAAHRRRSHLQTSPDYVSRAPPGKTRPRYEPRTARRSTRFAATNTMTLTS